MNIVLTQNLKGIKDSQPFEVQKQIIEGVYHYAHEYQKSPAPPAHRAYIFQQHIQESIAKKDLKAQGVTCSKGCFFCCLINVDITEDEAKLLVEFAKDENIPIDKERLQKQLNHTNEEYVKLPVKDRKCVFLGDDGCCKVYEVRPMNCRKYHVIDDPSVCASPAGTKVGIMVDWNAEICASGVMNAVSSGTMAEMLLKELE